MHLATQLNRVLEQLDAAAAMAVIDYLTGITLARPAFDGKPAPENIQLHAAHTMRYIEFFRKLRYQ